MFKVLSLLARFRRRTEGATAVEFAFIAPVFFMLMWGIVEVGMLAFAATLLEGAVREAARVGVTGYAPSGTTQTQHVKDTIAKYTAGFIDMGKLNIGTKSYSGFSKVGVAEPYTDSNGNGQKDAGEPFTDTNGNGQWDSDQGKDGLGASGEVVVYTLTYDWNFFAGYAKDIFGVSTVKLKASLAVRNEPY